MSNPLKGEDTELRNPLSQLNRLVAENAILYPPVIIIGIYNDIKGYKINNPAKLIPCGA
jgi:hypothetical protein